MCNNPIQHLPNIYAYVKFGQIPLIEDIEQKRNSDINNGL